MKRKDHSNSSRNQPTSRFAWLEEISQYWGKPWLVCLWLAAVVAAMILSLVPGRWISLTRHFPSLSSDLADAIEPLSHLVGYAVLVGFVAVACKTRARLIFIYIAALVIGVASEMLQIVLPGRGASFGDLSMNVIGTSAGFLFGLARLKRKLGVSLGGQGR